MKKHITNRLNITPIHRFDNPLHTNDSFFGTEEIVYDRLKDKVYIKRIQGDSIEYEVILSNRRSGLLSSFLFDKMRNEIGESLIVEEYRRGSKSIYKVIYPDDIDDISEHYVTKDIKPSGLERDISYERERVRAFFGFIDPEII